MTFQWHNISIRNLPKLSGTYFNEEPWLGWNKLDAQHGVTSIVWSALAGKRGNLGKPQHSIQSMLLRWHMSSPHSPVQKKSLWSQVLLQDSALAGGLTNYSGKSYSSLRTDKKSFLNKPWYHTDVDIFMTEKRKIYLARSLPSLFYWQLKVSLN